MAETQLTRLGPWPKGMLLGLDAAQVPADALYWAKDVNIENDGSVTRRPAMSEHAGTINAWRLHEWITDGGETYNIVSVEDPYVAVYRNGAAGAPGAEDDKFTLTTPSANWLDKYGWDFVQLNSDDLYVSYGWQDPSAVARLTWNGSGSAVTVTPITAAAFATATPDAGTASAEFPWARHALVKHERVFTANIDYNGGGSYPSRIHYSDLLKPEAWYGLYYLDVDPDHGGGITAMADYGDSILIFKEDAIYMLSGSTPDTFAVTKLTDTYGTYWKQTVAVDGSDVYFYDKRLGIIRFTGEQFVNISEPFNDWLEDSTFPHFFVFDGYLHAQVYAQVHGDMIAADAGHFVWRYNTATGAWSVWELRIVSSVVSQGHLYVGIYGEDGFYSLSNIAASDSFASGNDNIAASVVTGIVAPATPGGGCRLRRVDLNTVNKYYTTGGTFAPISIYAYRDFGAAPFASTSVSPTAAARNHRLSGFGNKRWGALRFAFDNNDQSGSWGVSSIDLRYTQARRQRGVAV